MKEKKNKGERKKPSRGHKPGSQIWNSYTKIKKGKNIDKEKQMKIRPKIKLSIHN